MTAGGDDRVRTNSADSADGTSIAYSSLGEGPGLIIVGGVLSSGADYLPLAHLLARDFEVHVMERRGRPGSGPQRRTHSMQDECSDLVAVAERTGATMAFGHSFGGLIALETARRRPVFDRLVLYEPGVPLRGRLSSNWLAGYAQRLGAGDRRGAFAWMVKHNGFAPAPLAVLPLWLVRAVLRLAIRSRQWEPMDRLLETNLVEHRVLVGLDAPSGERFSAITADTLLMGGSKSPAPISRRLLTELAEVIPNAAVTVLPGLDHLAPRDDPGPIVTEMLRRRTPHPLAPGPPGYV